MTLAIIIDRLQLLKHTSLWIRFFSETETMRATHDVIICLIACILFSLSCLLYACVGNLWYRQRPAAFYPFRKTHIFSHFSCLFILFSTFSMQRTEMFVQLQWFSLLCVFYCTCTTSCCLIIVISKKCFEPQYCFYCWFLHLYYSGFSFRLFGWKSSNQSGNTDTDTGL